MGIGPLPLTLLGGDLGVGFGRKKKREKGDRVKKEKTTTQSDQQVSSIRVGSSRGSFVLGLFLIRNS